MLNKDHQNLLRDLRSWCEINLEAMQATDLSERQFLSLLGNLLGKIQPGFAFGRALPQVKGIAAILEGFSKVFQEERSEFWIPSRRNLAFDGRLASLTKAARVRYQYVHEDSHKRFMFLPERLLEPCAFLSAEQLDWLLQAGRKLRELFLPASTCNAESSLEDSGQVAVSQHPEKMCIFLNASGAKKLSPSFLAACIISLSAAGFQVDFKMNGADDIPVPLHPNIELLQIVTAGDCTFHLKQHESNGHGRQADYSFFGSPENAKSSKTTVSVLTALFVRQSNVT